MVVDVNVGLLRLENVCGVGVVGLPVEQVSADLLIHSSEGRHAHLERLQFVFKLVVIERGQGDSLN